jgi:hypothetical protein
MEHRLAHRYKTHCAVDIFQGHRCIVQGTTCNVSKDGALLEADSGPLLRHGHVELELSAPDSGVSRRRLRGVVIHSDDLKLGVMLLDRWNMDEWTTLTKPPPRVPIVRPTQRMMQPDTAGTSDV